MVLVCTCVKEGGMSVWVVQTDVKHWIVAQSVTIILCVAHFKHFKC